MNAPMDMSGTIIAKSDQINAADLVGISRTITVKEVRIKAGEDQPVTILVDGDNKAFRPCKGVRRLLVRVWGPDANKYIGQSLTVYCDPTVTWAGKPEGGIRVSHMTGLDEKIIEYMRTSREKTKPYEILPLKAAPSKPDKAAEGTRDLIARLNEVGAGKMADTILASAEVVKQRAYLASKRPELAAELDACVAALQAADDDPFAETAPAASAPQEDGGAADSSSQPAPEGRSDDQHGEYDAIRECCDRLVADARAGAGRSAGEQAEYEALPEEMRAEVDAAAKGGE